MSWRQPESTRPSAKTRQNASRAVLLRLRKCEKALIRHLRDLVGMIALQKTPGFLQPKPGIDRFNAEEEAVTTGANKIRRIKYWMIGLGQAVKSEHSKYCGQSCSQNSALKRDRNKCRPGVIRFATDVERVIHD